MKPNVPLYKTLVSTVLIINFLLLYYFNKKVETEKPAMDKYASL